MTVQYSAATIERSRAMITEHGHSAMFGGTQKEFLTFILQLKTENPELEIKFCVDNGELTDDTGWTNHEISHVAVRPLWGRDDGRIEVGASNILGCMAHEIWKDFGFSDARTKALAEMRYNEEVKYAICVFTWAA